MVKALIVRNNEANSLAELKSYVVALGCDYEITDANALSVPDDCNFVVLSGGQWYSNETIYSANYQNEREFIRKTELPLFGICLGIHLIVEAYDGVVTKVPERHGIAAITYGKTESKVYEHHTRGVTQISDIFETLATSDTCIEAIRHRSREIYGVQFHPEIPEQGNNGGILFAELVRQALTTMK